MSPPRFLSSVTTVSGISVLAVSGSARWWPLEPRGWWPLEPRGWGWGLGQWCHPLAGCGLGESDAVAGCEHDVGVVHEPVDGGVGVGVGVGHEFIEAGRMQVA